MVAEPAGSMAWYSALPGRAEWMGSSGAIQRNRDGVPVWDGEPSTLEEFTEACLRYEQTVVREKRYLCGPRIASELRGPAKRVLLGRPADWLSYEGGVRRLIEELRLGRGQPKVPEMSELLMKYFKGTKRGKGETMGDYVTKKAEAYTRAQQSMARYLKEQEHGPTWRSSSTSWWQSPQLSDAATAGGTRAWSKAAPADRGVDDEERWEVYSQLEDGERPEGAGDRELTQARLQAYQTGPVAQSWENGGWSQRVWHHRPQSYDTTEWSQGQLPEILPTFIQGWYLFMDSGLDVMERNVLQAELRGDFSVQAVETVLRKHWHDADLRRRDSEKGRFQANWAEQDDWAEEWSCMGEMDPVVLEQEGYSADDIEALMADQEVQREALVAMDNARRTLRDARARQHAVKTARQFYPVNGRTGNFSRPGGQDGRQGPMKCFRCGGPHKIAQCPERPRDSAKVVEPSESAPFVFLTETLDQESACVTTSGEKGAMAYITTSQVVDEGKAIIDGGATRSIGSTHALARILELNERKRGHDGLKSLDMADRPSFGFGNSSRDRCASTANLSVPWNGSEGVIKVHALDKGSSPVLMSIDSLRRLGAIIDFEADLAIFRKVDPQKVVKLERSAAGHQVMPLTEDAFADSKSLGTPMPSFADLC